MNIGGTLCARVVLRTEVAQVPAHVIVDLGTRGPMLVHYGTAALLGFQRDGVVDVLHEQGGVILSKVKSVAMPLEPAEELTQNHAKELDNIPAVAVIGLPAFAGMVVELDVGEKILRFAPVDGNGDAGNTNESVKQTKLKYTAEAYGYWLAAEGPKGASLRVRFATSEYDTRINSPLAERLGFPGGDLDKLLLGDINLVNYAVLRPTDLSGFPDPKPDVILGTQLLSAFRVRVNPDQQELTFIHARQPQVPEHERQFFVARAKKDVRQVEAFLQAHADSRLAGEAAETLMQLCLDEKKVSAETIKRALRLRVEAAEPERRAMAMVTAADELIALDTSRTDAYDLALLALEVGKQYAPVDLNDTAVHHINARLGLIAMLRGDMLQARRLLLSAAFGIPKDPYVNFYLGHLYDKTGQQSRAWSRYLESCLKHNSPVGALRGLDRLNNDPTFRRQFTMADAAQLLEGRLPAFVPARAWEPASKPAGRPVRLIELFTSTEVPNTQAPQMAFDAMVDYLKPAGTVLLEYHVDDVLSSDATDARAEYYDVRSCPAAFFDGSGAVTDGGEDEVAARLFSTYREQAVQEASAAGGPKLTGQAILVNDDLRVTIRIEPQNGSGRYVLHAMLCENAVMLVGKNGQVLHRNVVRAPLAPAEGYSIDAAHGGRFSCEISLWAASQRLQQRIDDLAQRLRFTPAMRPTWIDPAACQVIAFLQEPEPRRVVSGTAIPIQIEGVPVR